MKEGARQRSAGVFTSVVPPDEYELPHPPIPLPEILLIRRVLLEAFAVLRACQYNLAGALEDQVTASLCNVIEDRLRQTGEVSGFSQRTYESVRRQGHFANYDSKKYSKAPDLCFRLRRYDHEPRPVLSQHEALFIECKPVDDTHSAGSAYCDAGLCRFVEGDYAWAMEQAMMIGYARNGRTIATHLIPAMRETERVRALLTEQFPEPVTAAGAAAVVDAEAVHVSRHRREFPWPDGKGTATSITIFHLWHQCT